MTYLMPYLLELSGTERIYIQNLIAQLPNQHKEVFLIEYRRRRKDPQTVFWLRLSVWLRVLVFSASG